MKPIKAKLLATATAAAIAMTPMAALAQQTQLEAQVQTELEQMGFDLPSDAMFSVSESAEIQAILSSEEAENEKMRQIEEILDARATVDVSNGAQDADVMVADELRSYGYNVDPANLSAELTAQLTGIMESDKSSADKRRAIEVALGDVEYEGIEIGIEPEFDAGLAALLQSELADMGLEVDVSTLTTAQMAEIKAVLETDDSTTDKERAIMSIIAG
ncbi:hypothetical protein GE300_10565 [Rhodobacteraceae bacterium 2CG4]|uniref:Uncharacterized protein n=1 Tax=Halovulum marinum TaxID=2662447 RepID=A0A6L5Z0I6_9RHOB|nr:hypothetical protein [Halovulum marinum]MSU90051.1 hypothetical protein [Halovulum marinum]